LRDNGARTLGEIKDKLPKETSEYVDKIKASYRRRYGRELILTGDRPWLINS
jgi:hypothetical protein